MWLHIIHYRGFFHAWLVKIYSKAFTDPPTFFAVKSYSPHISCIDNDWNDIWLFKNYYIMNISAMALILMCDIMFGASNLVKSMALFEYAT